MEFAIEEISVSVSMSTTPSLTGAALIADDGSQFGIDHYADRLAGVQEIYDEFHGS